MCDINFFCACSLLGGILLIASLYSVLWGKCKEQSIDIRGGAQDQAEKECTELKEAEVASSEPPLFV